MRDLASRLWGSASTPSGEHAYGKGRVIWGRPLREVLTGMRITPDLRFSGKESDLDFAHRRLGATEIYFVRNKSKQWLEGDAKFRVTGKQPEIWRAESGAMEPREDFTLESDGVRLPLRLEPEGSLFVVFRKAAAATGAVAPAPQSVQTLAIDGPWQVQFAKDLGAPESATFQRLASWTHHPDDGVRYYSGIAEYSKQWTAPQSWLTPGRRIVLDLGDLWAIAEVTVNSKQPKVVWKHPFRVDITGDVRTGRNDIRIRVANNWVNRLVGDARGAGPRITRTNVTSNSPSGTPWAKVEPRPSGLFGPVRMHSARSIDDIR